MVLLNKQFPKIFESFKLFCIINWVDDEDEEVKSIGTGRKILSADAANFGSLEEQQHHMMMMLRNAIAMVS